MEFKKHIHFDKDLENAVLGACLLEKSAFSRVHGILKKEVFYSSGNKIIFDCLETMWKENFAIDIFTVTSFAARKGHETIENFDTAFFVTRLTNFVVSSSHLEYHSLILRQLFAERELLRIRNDNQEGGVMERAKKIQDEIQTLFTIKTANDWQDMSSILFSMYQHMAEVADKELIGVPTGFRQLDLVTGGLVKTQLIAIGARPSVGKSAFISAVALNAASLGFKVGVISLEMPGMQVGARMSSIYSGIDFWKIFRNKLNKEEGENLYMYVQKMSELPIKISDKTQVDIYDIKAKATKLITQGGLDLLIIDYLQLIEGETNRNLPREQEVSRLSRGLKLMAMEYNIPVVILCQLNRESEKAVGKKPQLHHLRESGSIEQDCDGVIFLHRDFKSGITEKPEGGTTEFEADLIVAKWRNGETPEIKIGFDPPKMRFFDLNGTNSPRIESYKSERSDWKPYKEN